MNAGSSPLELVYRLILLVMWLKLTVELFLDKRLCTKNNSSINFVFYEIRSIYVVNTAVGNGNLNFRNINNKSLGNFRDVEVEEGYIFYCTLICPFSY